MKTKMKIMAVCLLSVMSITSCDKYSDDVLVDETMSQKLAQENSEYQQKSGPYSGDCSFPFDGEIKSWTDASYTLTSNATTTKKYTWRVTGGTDGNPLTRLQWKIKSNSSYPIIVRVIGIKSGSSVGDVIQSCYLMDTYGNTKAYDINPVASTKNWLNQWVGTYKYYQFEVIVRSQSITGNSTSSIPVQITRCRSSGGSCYTYPAF